MSNQPFKFENGSEVMISVLIEGTCKCGGTFKIGEVVSGGPSGYVAIHSEPHCAEYERLGIIDYMRWLRTGVEHMN